MELTSICWLLHKCTIEDRIFASRAVKSCSNIDVQEYESMSHRMVVGHAY